MTFSVVIPLYNKAPYIRKALESVFAQTYTDYELIVVDDGSTDDSAKVAEEFINSSLPFREGLGIGFFRQANAGVSAARNNGVAQAHGEYLAFLDADDWWEPTYLERMVQLIEDYPNAGLYACNYVYYKPGKTHVALNIPTGYINYPKAYCESDAMPVLTNGAMIPRKVFEEMGGFPLGIKLGEDFLLWSKIAMHYPVAFLNEPLAYYNNDVPATLRATRNLHAPKHHMLFRLEEIKDKPLLNPSLEGRTSNSLDNLHSLQGGVGGRLDSLPFREGPGVGLYAHCPDKNDWSLLIDKLRVNGLLDYWMSREYHEQAKAELSKVDWTKQSASVKRMYKTPLWMLKLKRMVMQVGSFVKQKLRMMNILISRRMQNESINR